MTASSQVVLTAQQALADVKSGDRAPPIPAGVKAFVTNRSAIGEQYVDLRPGHDGAPCLDDRSVIDQSDAAIPLPVETVLLNLNRPVAGVPNDSYAPSSTNWGNPTST